MKEIDFLPEWYKSGQRRRISYRTQYIALCGVFLGMVAWNFVATNSISKARAQFGQMSTRQTEAEMLSSELAELISEMKGLEKKTQSIDEIVSKIDVASVLAEMSFLIDKRIVLSKVVLVAERFEEKQQARPSTHSGTVVRAVRTKLSPEHEQPLGDVRFRVTIGGVAADASDVASLICKLEDSTYFCQVVPLFSRAAEINTVSSTPSDLRRKSPNVRGGISETGGNIRISEFEISCYLANYREQ